MRSVHKPIWAHEAEVNRAGIAAAVADLKLVIAQLNYARAEADYQNDRMEAKEKQESRRERLKRR
jgi:hypothetical protein